MAEGFTPLPSENFQNCEKLVRTSIFNLLSRIESLISSPQLPPPPSPHHYCLAITVTGVLYSGWNPLCYTPKNCGYFKNFATKATILIIRTFYINFYRLRKIDLNDIAGKMFIIHCFSDHSPLYNSATQNPIKLCHNDT